MTNKLLTLLPHRFELRPYQKDVFEKFFKDGIRRFISVWHRRAGKDRTFFNLMIAASQQRVGNYAYLLPEAAQAKKIIWDGIDKNGLRFLDHIPNEIIESVNNSEMIVYFKNGSTLQLGGSDHYNRHRGTNYVGVVFSEYSFGHPLGWEFIRPILVQNKGWAAFAYTPNGNNHGRKLYKVNKENKDWHVTLLTCNETKTRKGKRIITEADIEEEIRSGMCDEDIQQEFYCSFTSSIKGSYFGKELAKAEKDKRIMDIAIDNRYPVIPVFDLGFNDSMAIWLIQLKPDNFIDHIYYYENQFEKTLFYINKLSEIKKELGIGYSTIALPHDGSHKTYHTGKSTAQVFREHGFHVAIVPRSQNKHNSIVLARNYINRCRFHKTYCETGISALENYRSRFNKVTSHFGEPLHDWASHGADAFITGIEFINKNEGVLLRGAAPTTFYGSDDL